MKFDVKCVKEYLKENGFVFTVRGFDMKDNFVNVEGIGKCWRKKIKEIESKFGLWDYHRFSGFKCFSLDGGYIEYVVNEWWETIEKFCKGKPKWLYLVVKVEEERGFGEDDDIALDKDGKIIGCYNRVFTYCSSCENNCFEDDEEEGKQ